MENQKCKIVSFKIKEPNEKQNSKLKDQNHCRGRVGRFGKGRLRHEPGESSSNSGSDICRRQRTIVNWTSGLSFGL